MFVGQLCGVSNRGARVCVCVSHLKKAAREENASQIHRCEHQTASISRMEEALEACGESKTLF